jgi:hypothetical protein
MAYVSYYIILMFLSYASRNPLLMVGIILLVLLRPVLPDPITLWRTLGRLRAHAARLWAFLGPAPVAAERPRLDRRHLPGGRPP